MPARKSILLSSMWTSCHLNSYESCNIGGITLSVWDISPYPIELPEAVGFRMVGKAYFYSCRSRWLIVVPELYSGSLVVCACIRGQEGMWCGVQDLSFPIFFILFFCHLSRFLLFVVVVVVTQLHAFGIRSLLSAYPLSSNSTPSNTSRDAESVQNECTGHANETTLPKTTTSLMLDLTQRGNNRGCRISIQSVICLVGAVVSPFSFSRAFLLAPSSTPHLTSDHLSAIF